MKKIGILVILFGAMTITSCKKYLDIKPQQRFGSNLAVTSIQGLQQTVLGGFSQMQSGNLYGGGIISNSELLADYVNASSSTAILTGFSTGQEYTHQMNIYNSNAGGMWGDGYAAILTANTVLQYLPNFQSSDPATCKLLRGESLFIRAAMHFELVRMFAQPSGYSSDDSHLGIPIRLTPGTPVVGQNTPRSTVAQVYAQVIADLQAADSLLPADRQAVGVAASGGDYVSKYAAEALLAKVYFSMNNGNALQNYASAETYATKVINAGFTLNDSLTAVYNQLGTTTTNESIFQIINSAKDDPSSGNLNGNFSHTIFGSIAPNYAMNAPFVSILRADSAVGGLRYAKLFRRSVFAPISFFCTKYSAQYSNVTVIRLAEMYLTRAECEAKLGDDAGARADYNKIRVRGGLVPDNSSTGAGLIAAIRAERDLELAMEGDHYFEVKRRKGSFNTPGAGVLQWNDPTMIYPIPQQEVQENKAIVQNPGY